MDKKEIVEHLEYLGSESKRIALDDGAIDTEFQSLIAGWEEFKSQFQSDPLMDKEVLEELLNIEREAPLSQVIDRTPLLDFLTAISVLGSLTKANRNKKRKQLLMQFSIEASGAAFNLKMGNLFKK